ncbi:MAG: twin-arginine translocation signal domain-containing protein, partial [Planctomycetota bacterium]
MRIMNRRDFLKTASLSTAALAMDGVLARGQTVQTKPATQSSNAPKLPRREYG